MWRVKYGGQYLHDPVGDERARAHRHPHGDGGERGGMVRVHDPRGPSSEEHAEGQGQVEPRRGVARRTRCCGRGSSTRGAATSCSRAGCRAKASSPTSATCWCDRTRPSPGKQPLTAPSSVDGYFSWLIDRYNERVDSSRRFVVGVNNGAALDRNNHILRESSQLPTGVERDTGQADRAARRGTCSSGEAEASATSTTWPSAQTSTPR